ncbi:hypothetical protein BDV59DRAFT_185627 [Aspergillus ambiguus]|uniref:DUF4419 domain-containing protein n=1 Tax=Aspergillus ambiguus TaxID=176160 RepID=UPI003CCE22EC
MPVTITTAPHPPREWSKPKVNTAKDLFKESCEREYRRSRRMIQSSFPPSLFDTSHISASKHGFVWAVFHAYSYHHNLTIRPEDVWFSILTQLSFFINAHAEELRSYFVAHEGQKELVIRSVGTIETADFGALAIQMTELIEKNVVDPELRSWIMPQFTTTTESDSAMAAILTMGATQKYFSFTMFLLCGIPSVTLLGEREDWECIVKKLDKLYQLGDEPARFAQLLRPVLNHFVLSFDSPGSPEAEDFWGRCADCSGGSGPSMMSGWITAFCFWNEEGTRMTSSDPLHPVSSPEFEARNTDFGLDDVFSRQVDTEYIPTGYASVSVTVNDNGAEHKTTMLAGLVGIEATSSGVVLDGTTPATMKQGLDSIQPLSGWWMYEKETEEEAERRDLEIQKLKDEIVKIEASGGGVESALYRKYHELIAF